MGLRFGYVEWGRVWDYGKDWSGLVGDLGMERNRGERQGLVWNLGKDRHGLDGFGIVVSPGRVRFGTLAR